MTLEEETKKSVIAVAENSITSGFNRLKRHNYIVTSMDDTEVKTCRLCELDDETSSHRTTDCEVLWQERVDAFQFMFLD